MQRTFQDRFDFENWQGDRASGFGSANDAFQQLVGDGLKADFGAGAWAAPTAGRDGSIDAWVEGFSGTHPMLPTLGARFIVECKWHDATAKDPKGNIKQGWSSVAAKLTKQAADGWPDAYAPWKNAHGYLYCISLRFPDQASRDALRDTIRDFFDSLPAAQRLPISRDAIHVWDWADIAHWLRSHQRVADLWLGLDAGDLIDHASFRARLVAQRDTTKRIDFRSYLLDDNLPFVPPPTDDPCHPDMLFARLQSGGNLLLLGEGGVGKTRTAFEVAERSDRSGWRVLHLTPPDTGIDPRRLLAELAYPGDTLVVVDYIDKIQNFDARYWRETLLPEVARRNGRLRLIANARPSDSLELLESVKASGLFFAVDLNPQPERRRSIVTEIATKLCPKAVTQLGVDSVRVICGTRPIIAMFVARELEEMAAAGHFSRKRANSPSSRDLIAWLHRRLPDDQLLHRQTGDRWNFDRPSAGLCAAVATLVAAPMSKADIVSVAAATLTAANSDPLHAQLCVDRLCQSGWLELGEDQVRTPHDAIADETLVQLLSADIRVLPWILASAEQGRALGRFAVGLGRLSGNGRHNAELERATKEWLENSAAKLGCALTNISPSVGSYALAAVFDCPYWAETAAARWSDLVAPWLGKFGATECARYVLDRALRMPGTSDESCDAAFAWLEKFGTHDIAGYVLYRLVAWKAEALGARQNRTLEFTLSWLRKCGASESAQFVLHELLNWKSARLGQHLGEVLDLTVQWLRDHHAKEVAGFVLGPLLGWDASLLGQRLNEIQTITLQWLGTYKATEVARFVFVPCLGKRASVMRDQRPIVLEISMQWLGTFGNKVTAGFVLAPLLFWDASHLGDTHQATALDIATTWLRTYEKDEAAAYVLDPLLDWRYPRLLKQQKINIQSCAMRWLILHRERESAQFVLHPLLKSKSIYSNSQNAELVLGITLKWIGKHSGSECAQFVFNSLLRWSKPQLGDNDGMALSEAMKWLDSYGSVEIARFVLCPLLDWEQPRIGDHYPALIEITVHWLKQHGMVPDAYLVLHLLLADRSDFGLHEAEAHDFASRWLSAHAGSKNAQHVLNGLLRSNRIRSDAELLKTLIGTCLRWLESHWKQEHAKFVLQPLLGLNTASLATDNQLVLEYAIRWLEEYGRKKKSEAWKVLRPLQGWDSSRLCSHRDRLLGLINEMAQIKTLENRDAMLIDILRNAECP